MFGSAGDGFGWGARLKAAGRRWPRWRALSKSMVGFREGTQIDTVASDRAIPHFISVFLPDMVTPKRCLINSSNPGHGQRERRALTLNVVIHKISPFRCAHHHYNARWRQPRTWTLTIPDHPAMTLAAFLGVVWTVLVAATGLMPRWDCKGLLASGWWLSC